MCGKLLKALLPMLLKSMERHAHLQVEENVRLRLLGISAATINRKLRLCGKRPQRPQTKNGGQ